MTGVIPQSNRFLRDAFGSATTDGACVIDSDREVGYGRLELGPHLRGPDSAYWDGRLNVTATRGVIASHCRRLDGPSSAKDRDTIWEAHPADAFFSPVGSGLAGRALATPRAT
jgi:hypothetical protein